MSLLSRLFRREEKAGIPSSWPINWFQLGTDYRVTSPPGEIATFSAVFSCLAAISQDLSRSPLQAWRALPRGGYAKVDAGAVAALLRSPTNSHTQLEWLQHIALSLLTRGNAFCLAERNGRFEVTALHPLHPDSVSLHVPPEIGGEPFYRINGVADLLPQWAVCHFRINPLRHPLVGVPPITAAALSGQAGLAASTHMSDFFAQMARPGGVLSTPNVLNKDVVARLREQWSNQEQGRTAVLEQGLQWTPLTLSAVEADLVNALKWTVSDVARAFRVPEFLIGSAEKMTARNAETGARLFVSQTLLFYAEAIEQRLESFLGLEDIELEFDFETAMRAETDVRMAAWAQAVQGGILTPNQARAREGEPPEPGGDRLLVQRQMVPVELATELAQADIDAKNRPAPAPALPGPAEGKPKGLHELFRGKYEADVFYEPGDITVKDGSCWLCVKTLPAAPGDDDSWALIARGLKHSRGGIE